MTVDQVTIDVAVEAVEAAVRLTSAAQGRIADGDTLTKSDDSPVTVADFGAQAVVCSVLVDRLGSAVIVGEEHPDDLGGDRRDMAHGVTDLVRAALGRHVSVDEVEAAVGLGVGSADADRYWTLDPIDGTKGFLRGDQYAIALALIEHGEVVLGVLGCPNYPVDGGRTGLVLVGTSEATVEISGDGVRRSVGPDAAIDVVDARFCESVESGHSDHSSSADIAARLGIATTPLRIDSQCKYAAVARGDADVYLRLPTRAGYREKIWDHAAGLAVVHGAGGTVTDVAGRPLDFTQGARLQRNRGIVATRGGFHDDVVAVASDVVADAGLL